jgi:dimeric dUTPase (all-alpha-NTP-PPase superfamily)
MNVELREMLRLQDQVNAKINPAWRSAGNAFHRAVLVEAVEAMDHHGWKWWSKQTPNMAQVRLELVDIWHFALSMVLVRLDGDIPACADAIEAAWNEDSSHEILKPSTPAPRTLLERLERIAGLAAFGHFSFGTFSQACADVDLPFARLFREYVAKNVLNHFRQDNGYKAGTYQKLWQGREDNEHLFELLAALDVAPEHLANALYDALVKRYAECRT